MASEAFKALVWLYEREFSYELKVKAGNTKFLAKLEGVRKAKAIAQLKLSDSKEDVIWSAEPADKCPRAQPLPCQGLHMGWGAHPKRWMIWPLSVESPKSAMSRAGKEKKKKIEFVVWGALRLSNHTETPKSVYCSPGGVCLGFWLTATSIYRKIHRVALCNRKWHLCKDTVPQFSDQRGLPVTQTFSSHGHSVTNLNTEDHVLTAANTDLCLDLFLPEHSSQWFFQVYEARVLEPTMSR